MIDLRLRHALLWALALSISAAGVAHADDAVTIAKDNETQKTKSGDDSLTWNGITIYGKIDAGVAHQMHGARFYLGISFASYMRFGSINMRKDSFLI